MKIGIYGGTFNPIHLGHMAAAKFAAEHLELDKLYLIPAGIPPHKVLQEDTAGHQHRLDMVQLAADAMALPGVVEAVDWELNRKGKSYTWETVEAIHKRFPKDQLYLLMGTDMFLTFQYWRYPERIAKRCTLCAFGRTQADTQEVLAPQRVYLEETFSAKVVTLTLPHIVEISSTRLRQLLREGGGREYLDPLVYGYILREGLYGVERDLRHLSLDDLRQVALTMLVHSRIPHVLGTEETAAKLALRWGADEEEARRAALLHDCTKKENREQQLALCRQYHIDVEKPEKLETKLFHAITGAAVAEQVFGLSPAAVSAIRWHTTGKADMTLLEKIIYLADYIEPTRDFCDLTELRRLAYEDLDRAMLLGFTMAVDDLQKKGMVVHPDSVRARDYLKGIMS